jgi:hypothetical protein
LNFNNNGVVTDYNMAEAELRVIDTARQDAIRLSHPMQFDARAEISYMRCLMIIYDTILPKLEQRKNQDIYRDKKKVIDAHFAELKELSFKEYRHALKIYERSNSLIPASRTFMDKSDFLFQRLMILKDNLGMGLRHSDAMSDEGAFERAAD